VSSCSDKKQETTDSTIIPQNKFTEILAECQLAESQMTVMRVLQPIYKDSILNYYAGIFKANNINSEDFYYSLKHYTKDPTLMDSIYSGILEILNNKSAELGPVELPKSNLNAISRKQLGDIIYQTPYSEIIIKDHLNGINIREDLMTYIDSNIYLIDSAKVDRDSFQFSLIINTSTKIMYNQLQDYLLSKSNILEEE
jgi:hypothetical protein